MDEANAACYAQMMIATSPLSEADILSDMIVPNSGTFSRQVAEEFLALRFDAGATARIGELLQKNNAGSISDVEKSTLDNFLRVGMFLDLLQAKARVTLQKDRSSE